MHCRVIVKWVLIVIAGALINETAICAPEDSSLNPFSASVLNELVLRQDEVPPDYKLIINTNLLTQAGLSQNPDYLTRRADLEDAIQMNGAAVFLALYGSEESVRLMVKGVFFRKPEHAAKYAKVQGTRKRLVMAFRKDTTGGVWLLFIACDPDLKYDETEMRLIAQGLESYQRRLTLSTIFDQINAGHTGRK